MDEFCNEFDVLVGVQGDRNEGQSVFTYTTFYHQITRFFGTHDIAG